MNDNGFWFSQSAMLHAMNDTSPEPVIGTIAHPPEGCHCPDGFITLNHDTDAHDPANSKRSHRPHVPSVALIAQRNRWVGG